MGSNTRDCPSGSDTRVNFGAELISDSNAYALNTTYGSIQVKQTGTYRIQAQVGLAVNSAGYRQIRIKRGDTYDTASTLAIRTIMATTTSTPVSIERVTTLNAGQFIFIDVNQSSGTTLAISTGSGYTFASVTRLK